MAVVLVTGSNGQLGSELQRLAVSRRDGATCVAAGGSGAVEYVFTDIDELDATDADAVWEWMHRNGADVLVNCAAYTNVDGAETDREKADLLNHRAAAGMAEVCRDLDATLIHVSTDYVFDGKTTRPYTEDAPAAPLNVYGATKLAGERAIMDSGCKCLILRTSWLYSSFGGNFVKTMLRLSAERDALSVVNDQRGTPTYAADLAGAIDDIIGSGAYRDREGVYHYSGAGECTWFDFAREIVRLSGNGCRVLPVSSAEYGSKAARPEYSVLDKTKFKRTFGLPIPTWEDALERCVKILKAEGYGR